MKKLSLLVAILLTVTIGGVYAAFIYPGAGGDAKLEFKRAIYLEDATESGNIADFELTSDVKEIRLDQKYHDETLANSDYTVVMDTTFVPGNTDKNPNITLTFIPKPGANPTIKTKGVTSYIYFGFQVDHIYDDPTTNADTPRNIFEVKYNKTNYITIHDTDYDTSLLNDRNYKWTPSGDGFTVSLSHIATMNDVVKLPDEGFKLDSITEYNAFKTAMGDDFVQLIVTATTVQPV